MRRRTVKSRRAAWHLVCFLGLIGILFAPSVLFASHAADHRFTVEGFVCGKDSRPSTKIEVLVKDTRITVGQTVTTDDDGYYKITLHLHNDNVGDPLLVEAGGSSRILRSSSIPMIWRRNESFESISEVGVRAISVLLSGCSTDWDLRLLLLWDGLG